MLGTLLATPRLPMRWFRSLPFTRPALGLALQGGGAHGAFTWGVLDALLEDTPRSLAPAPDAPAGSTLGHVIPQVAAAHRRRFPDLGAA